MRNLVVQDKGSTAVAVDAHSPSSVAGVQTADGKPMAVEYDASKRICDLIIDKACRLEKCTVLFRCAFAHSFKYLVTFRFSGCNFTHLTRQILDSRSGIFQLQKRRSDNQVC